MATFTFSVFNIFYVTHRPFGPSILVYACHKNTICIRKYSILSILTINLARAASVMFSSGRPRFIHVCAFVRLLVSCLYFSEMKTACFRTASVALQGKKKAGNCRGEGEKVAGGARTTKA